MVNVTEKNTVELMLEAKKTSFNAQYAPIIERYEEMTLELQNTKRDIEGKIKEEINKLTKETEDVKTEIDVIKRKIEELITSDDFELTSQQFNTLRKGLKDLKEAKEIKENTLSQMVQKEFGMKVKIKELYQDIELIKGQLPFNPYQRVIEIIQANSDKRKYICRLSDIIDILKEQYNISLDVEILPHAKEENFEVVKAMFNFKEIKVEFAQSREEVDEWHNEIQGIHVFEIPVLNFVNREELLNTFGRINKSHLSVQIAADMKGKRYVKDIYIENPTPINEDETYIRIGTKVAETLDSENDFEIKGLEIDFSSYPFIF